MPGEIYIRDVAFTLPNAIGNFTITDTGGPGLTPKAALLVLSGATALDTITAHARMSVGMTDGTNHRAMAWMAEDSVLATNADTGKRLANDKVLNITGTAAEGLQVGATFVSFAANAITINVDAASTLRGFVRFFSGSDLQVNVTSLVGSATSNTAVSTTAPGFMPDGAIFIGTRTTNDFGVDTGLANAHVSIGAAGRLSSTTQACFGLVAGDREDPTSTGCKPRNDRVCAFIASSAGTISETASLELTSWDATGLTLTTRNGSTAITTAILSLRLGGEKFYADMATLNSNTSGISSYTTPGFGARAITIAGQMGSTVGSIDSTKGAFSFGGATTATGGVSAGWNSVDGLSAVQSQTQSYVSSTSMLSMPESGASKFWECSLSEITATGFDYNVTATDTSDVPTLILSIGEQPGGLGWIDARSGHRWRRRLARM